MKVLIISYYWPPSGGAGVQRWLKLSKYLSMMGVEVHVLTVHEDEASYAQLDPDLKNDIHPDVKVYKTKSFEPVKYYAKLVGKENVPTAGFSNVDSKSLKQKIVNSLRSNLFIPDPRRGWKKYAVKKGIEIIQKENIQTIITTSPPHSTQLIGLALKKKCKVKWIVDFRDPWTDIYYYDILGHTWLSKYIDQKLEKKILINADQIVTVSDGCKTSFFSKTPKISPKKIQVIPNGFDPMDFQKDKPLSKNKAFTICYTGTMSDQYEPTIFFDALQKLVTAQPDVAIKFQLIGAVSAKIKEYINELKLDFEFISMIPHDQINQYQQQADLLLLVIPNVERSKGIVTGKIFEYLGSLNKIIGIGPTDGDAAAILKQCNAGRFFDRKEILPIFEYLKERLSHFLNDTPSDVNQEAIRQFSRKYQAQRIKELL